MENQIKLRIEKTKSGYPALWEEGGGYSNTGDATIVAGKDGLPKKPLYVKRRGHLANSKHALIPVAIGDYVISADHHRGDFYIEISKILGFDVKEEETYAVIEKVNRFDKNEWDAELPIFLQAAVEAAKDKATCYHCRSAHYISE